MRTLLSLFTLLIAPFILADDMQNYLSDTEEMARAGKHEEALKRHIWFHNHALEHEPSMYGVRLSFALSSWLELGEKYPPALKALAEIRDQNVKSLLNGKNSHELFHDIASINETLGESDKTVSLFEQIDEKQPKTAAVCWNLAKDDLIDAKKFDLVRKYIGTPASEFSQVKAIYTENMALYDDPQIGGERFKKFNDDYLVTESLRLIKVFNALGDQKAALGIQTKALALIDDPRLSEAIPTDGSQ